MLSTLLSVSWEPEIRGYIVVLIGVVALMGSTYLLLGTNLGARLGFMVVVAGLSGWMMSMAMIWAVYGIGLKGPEPSWKPGQPITIVRDGARLAEAEVLKVAPKIAGQDPVTAADTVSSQMVAEGWVVLEEADPRRGQAVASADEIIQVEAKEFAAGEYLAVNVYDKGGERYPKIGDSLDFLAFFHKPHYAVVEIAPLVPQRAEPGRAPARPVIDETQPHRYVLMLRDLGARRQPAFLIALGSGLVFLIMVRLLHRREIYLRENLALRAPAA